MRICERFGAPFVPAPPELKAGVAQNVRTDLSPLNGLRHSPTSDTSGWYIWAGTELSSQPDFFLPSHIAHIHELCPRAAPYLGLGPGWRFLIADGYEDVWFDEALLDVD
jgi:hypothetical protein